MTIKYALVPTEPTDAMLDAAKKFPIKCSPDVMAVAPEELARSLWGAMLNAARAKHMITIPGGKGILGGFQCDQPITPDEVLALHEQHPFFVGDKTIDRGELAKPSAPDGPKSGQFGRADGAWLDPPHSPETDRLEQLVAAVLEWADHPAPLPSHASPRFVALARSMASTRK